MGGWTEDRLGRTGGGRPHRDVEPGNGRLGSGDPVGVNEPRGLVDERRSRSLVEKEEVGRTGSARRSLIAGGLTRSLNPGRSAGGQAGALRPGGRNSDPGCGRQRGSETEI